MQADVGSSATLQAHRCCMALQQCAWRGVTVALWGAVWHGTGAQQLAVRGVAWLWHGIARLCVWRGAAAGAAGHGLAGLQGLRGLAAGCSGAQQEARTKYVLNPGRDHNSPSH